MITVLNTRELYRIFLDSQWWQELSARKKRLVGKCEECGSKWSLVSHHIRYPAHWFDTTLEDLRVLCEECHKKEHGLEEKAHVPKAEEQTPTGYNRKLLETFRSNRSITRQKFLVERDKLKKLGLWYHPKKHRVLRRKRRQLKPCNPWHYNPNHRTKWTNRGTSTN